MTRVLTPDQGPGKFRKKTTALELRLEGLVHQPSSTNENAEVHNHCSIPPFFAESGKSSPKLES
jgi:hypothetical protein